MDFDDMSSAVEDAASTIRIMRSQVARMAKMCADRLQDAGVSHDTLCKLKRELESYNMHTGEWK